jgi:hypothetical protein
MKENKPRLFGIEHSNRDFSSKNTWGKNQFNSSFPASLAVYLYSKKLENIYIFLDKQSKLNHGKLSTKKLFGLNPLSDDLFFSFETPFTPYQKFLIGHLPRVDLVIQTKWNGHCITPIEIKLTALPDNSTCDFSEDKYSSEIVVRPDTIVYLACSIAKNTTAKELKSLNIFDKSFSKLKDWSDGSEVMQYIPQMIQTIDKLIEVFIEKQEPILMQPIWKTVGKNPRLAENCLDIFVWSNFAFIQLFLDVARKELSERKISRQIRTIIWLFKMLYDYSQNNQINHIQIIDELSYNTKNDKAFAVSGRVTHGYLKSLELTKPRIKKSEIKNIILGGGQDLLSPERRFDAIIYSSPELFI